MHSIETGLRLAKPTGFAVVALLFVFASACDDDGSGDTIDGMGGGGVAAGGNSLGGGGGAPSTGGSGGTPGVDGGVLLDAGESPLTATGMGVCYPRCFELLATRCLYRAGETITVEIDGGETRLCSSGGIRERSYKKTIDGQLLSVTEKTMPDSKTICLTQTNAPSSIKPWMTLRDSKGVVVVTVSAQEDMSMTCKSDGRTYPVQADSPSCVAARVRETLPFSQGKCEWLGPR